MKCCNECADMRFAASRPPVQPVTAAVYACAALRRALYDLLQSSFILC